MTSESMQMFPTAESLMRSRFEAFKIRDADWLIATWHPDTRPKFLELDDDIRWRGLQIVDTVLGGPDDDRGEVEFRATYVDSNGFGMLHERSRFMRLVDGAWVYVDGDILD